MKIYKKNAKQIEDERHEANVYCRMVKGLPPRISGYFMIDKKGYLVDGNKITELDFIDCVAEAIQANDLEDVCAFRMEERLKTTFKGYKQVLKLLDNKDRKVRANSADVFGDMYSEQKKAVDILARYALDSQGEFDAKPSEALKLKILDSLIAIEQQKQKKTLSKNEEQCK